MTDEKNNLENIQEEASTTENVEAENLNQDLETKISELEQENKNLNDKLLRLAAELENTRRRTREEVDKANKYAISNFANDLVVVLENFYLASNNLPEEEIKKSTAIRQFAEAMLMTKKDLTKTLEKFTIKRIFPLGEKFDHNFHEAISQIPSTDEEDGIIKQVIQAGYSIGDRLIKPALVSVAIKN